MASLAGGNGGLIGFIYLLAGRQTMLPAIIADSIPRAMVRDRRKPHLRIRCSNRILFIVSGIAGNLRNSKCF